MVASRTSERACQVWGVLNVTPDSFSDGGQAVTPDDAFAKARRLVGEGADVIDVGGASSRPPGAAYGAGAAAVSVAEELRRVLPVVQRIHRELGARVSIDTVHAEVAQAAIEAGASIVNDVSGATTDALLQLVARTGTELVLMHNRGDGSVHGNNAAYTDVVLEVVTALEHAAARAKAAGIAVQRLWLDPGLGFAKRAEDSIALLAQLPRLTALGFPVLVGPSRKAFIAAAERAATGKESTPAERLGGTCAAVTCCALLGARAVRVHDVRASRQALALAEAVANARHIGGQEAFC